MTQSSFVITVCSFVFTSAKVFSGHKGVCLKLNGPQKVKLRKTTSLSVTNFYKQLSAPFAIYADFECLSVPIREKHGNNTEAYQEHRLAGMHTRWFAHMMINIVNQQKYTEGLMLYINQLKMF